MVQTIFVLRIFINLHESAGESKKETGKVLYSRARSFQTRIEKVTQRVAKKINAEHGDKDAEAGEKRQPPGGADIDARVGQHGAPGGDVRRHADAEEAQARFGDDRRRHGEGADDE